MLISPVIQSIFRCTSLKGGPSIVPSADSTEQHSIEGPTVSLSGDYFNAAGP